MYDLQAYSFESLSMKFNIQKFLKKIPVTGPFLYSVCLVKMLNHRKGLVVDTLRNHYVTFTFQCFRL